MRASKRAERDVLPKSRRTPNSTMSTPDSATSDRTSTSTMSNSRPPRRLSGLEAPHAPQSVVDGSRRRSNYVPPKVESNSESDSEVDNDEVSNSSSDESSDEEAVKSETQDHEAEDDDDDSESEEEADDDDSSSQGSSVAEQEEVTRFHMSHRISVRLFDENHDFIVEEIDSETIEFDGLPVLFPSQFEDAESCAGRDDLDSDSSADSSSSNGSDEDDSTLSDGDRELARANKLFERMQIRKRLLRKRRRKRSDQKRKHDQALGSDLDIEDVVPLLEDDHIPHPQLPIPIQTVSSSGQRPINSHQRHPSNTSPTTTRRIRRKTEGPEERERPCTSILFDDVQVEIPGIQTGEQELVIADGDAENEEIIFPAWFHNNLQTTNMELDEGLAADADRVIWSESSVLRSDLNNS